MLFQPEIFLKKQDQFKGLCIVAYFDKKNYVLIEFGKI